MKRVVVTGIGAVTPIGNTVTEFWKNLLSGKSGAKPISKFDTTNFKTKFACEVTGFDPLQYMEKAEFRKTDLFTQYALASTDECVKNSGIDFSKCDPARAGVIWATGIGGVTSFEESMGDYFKNGEIPRFSPFMITKMLPNMAAGIISIRYGLMGASFTAVSACTSSNHSIAEAFSLIKSGKADVMLAGGSEAPITTTAVGGFNAMRAMSVRNESPETASRPFDQTRDGFVIAEGAGTILLEELEHAKRRGATIYAEFGGYGYASDAYHITSSHPEGLGAIFAMKEAMREAEVNPEDVDYINAHATSTPVGDISECKAIHSLFSEKNNRLIVGATKSMTGHLLGAAGAVEAISCIQAIRNSVIPPTINLKERDSEIPSEIKISGDKTIQTPVNTVLNNTFGFGGHIVSTLFKKYES